MALLIAILLAFIALSMVFGTENVLNGVAYVIGAVVITGVCLVMYAQQV